jgi:tetratricopeptide (TPR) repeat protein
MRARIGIFVLLSILAILGGIGGVIFGLHPVFGLLLIIAGLLGTIWGLWSSGEENAEIDQQFDTLAQLIQTGSIADFPIAVAVAKLKRTTSCRGLIEELVTKLQSHPQDTESAVMLILCLALQQSFRHWATRSDETKPFDQVEHLRTLVVAALKRSGRRHSTFAAAIGILRDLEGKHAAAQRWFRRSGQLRTDPYWRLLLSTSFGMSGRNAESLEQMQIAIQEGAKGWVVDHYLGRSLLHIGQYDQAVVSLQRAYSVRGNSPQLLCDLQDVYYRLGRFASSAKYQFLLSARLCLYFRKQSALHFAQALVHMLVGALFKASKILWKVSSRNRCLAQIHARCLPPDQPETTLSEILMSYQHYAMARIHIERALAICPHNVANLINLGGCCARLNDLPKAIALCDQVLAIDPNNLVAKYNKSRYETGSVGEPTYATPQPGFNVGATRHQP